ncbi:MAG: hypothetical protein WCE38_17930 [Burkholderiales bacterium]
MDTNTTLQARLLDRRPNLTWRELRVRAIGQSAAIVAIATLVLAAAALAGCDDVASAGARTYPAIEFDADSHAVAGVGEGEVRTGFDWRKADSVTYREEDWPSDLDRPVEY